MIRLFRPAGVRLALAFGGLFALSALTLVMVLWWATIGLLNGQVDAAIRADAQGLFERWRDGGAAALLSTIQSRVTGGVDDQAIYLVLDAGGRTVTGNLRAWPDAVDRVGAIYELPIERMGRASLARLHRFALPGGYSLLVGRDVQARAALRQLLTDTLGWALLLIAVLGVVGAMAVQRLFRRMLGHVTVTAEAISAGDLSPRFRLTGRGDEFDRLAATFNDMLDRIGRLMDGVRQVSNAIAHDLRTPITRARARLEDAAAHAGSTAELRSAVERAVADLDGITAVFQGLLRIAEIEAGARRSAFAPVDLRPLLSDLAELYGAVAEERGLRLMLHAQPPLTIWGDRELVQQAVANLLDNAVKFSPAGGVVTVSALVISDTLRVSVQDQGPGIPAPDQARATERFFRGDAARNTPGFGLGLALVRAVAGLHGGRVELSDASPGLCAVLVLPAGPQPDPSRRERRLAPEGEYQDIAMGGLGRV